MFRGDIMDRLEQNNIVKEVQDSFLDYSMSVITARAIPSGITDKRWMDSFKWKSCGWKCLL